MEIKHIPVEVILDKSQYGKSCGVSSGIAFSFYFRDKGNFEYITTRGTRDLIAVTDEQYKGWKNRKIVAIPVTIS